MLTDHDVPSCVTQHWLKAAAIALLTMSLCSIAGCKPAGNAPAEGVRHTLPGSVYLAEPVSMPSPVETAYTPVGRRMGPFQLAKLPSSWAMRDIGGGPYQPRVEITGASEYGPVVVIFVPAVFNDKDPFDPWRRDEFVPKGSGPTDAELHARYPSNHEIFIGCSQLPAGYLIEQGQDLTRQEQYNCVLEHLLVRRASISTALLRMNVGRMDVFVGAFQPVAADETDNALMIATFPAEGGGTEEGSIIVKMGTPSTCGDGEVEMQELTRIAAELLVCVDLVGVELQEE